MKRAVVLSLLLCISVPATVYGSDSCRAIFASKTEENDLAYRLDRMRARFFEITGIPTIENSELLDKTGFDAGFRRGDRNIIYHPGRDILKQFIAQHHEFVHGTTDQRLREKPNHPENVLAIQIWRDYESIHLDLPGEYHKYVQLDEMKAYFRTIALIRQLVREGAFKDDPAKLETILDYAKFLADDAGNFSSAMEEFFIETKRRLEGAAKGISRAELSRREYAPDAPAIVEIVAETQRAWGPPIRVSFKVFEPNAAAMKNEDFYPRIIKQCDDAIDFARYYKKRAAELKSQGE